MKVKIQVEFEVQPVDTCDEDFDAKTARSAASQAAYDYLSLVEVSGYGSDTDSVTVQGHRAEVKAEEGKRQQGSVGVAGSPS